MGRSTENTSEADGVTLRVLGAPTPVFEPTVAAMRYFAERTGKHYPSQAYTQVFLHGDAVRALGSGLMLLPESYSEGLAKEPDDLRLLASGLAQQ